MGLLSLLAPVTPLEKASPSKADMPERVGKSWQVDPFAYIESLTHRDRPSMLSYEQLRLMAMRCDVISAVLQTRINQVASFAEPVTDRFGIGYNIVMRDGRAPGTAAAAKMAQQLTYEIQFCGQPGMARDGFETFLRKFTRDSLIYDQACHPAGTMVEVLGGYRPIEDLREGDLVWSHTGQLRAVEEVKSRLYTGQMVTFRVRGQRVEATENHPFLVVPDRWYNLAPRRGKTAPRWMQAGEIQQGWYLMYPRVQLSEQGPAYVLPWGPALDAEWSFLLGLYAADGHAYGTAVCFTLGTHQKDVAVRLSDIAVRAGWRVVVEPESRGKKALCVRLNTGGSAIPQWFKATFGSRAVDKRVPDFVFDQGRAVRQAFLEGYLVGDGYVRTNKASFSTVSGDLFAGLRILFSAEGVYIADAKNREGGRVGSGWRDQYRANLSGEAYRAFAKSVGLPVDDALKTSEPVIYDDQYFYLKVRERHTRHVEDLPVFNCEVQHDHSYLANGVVSHNCAEIVPRRNGLPAFFEAVDASTIRLAASPTPPTDDKGHKLTDLDPKTPFQQAMQSYQRDLMVQQNGEEVPAKYVQLINGTVRASYADTELFFGVRNPRTDLAIAGYGMSELETLIGVVTSYLYAEEYNRRIFTQGSIPKGILNLKGEISDQQLAAFKREWSTLIAGVQNSWKTPVLNAEDIEYINLQTANKDMEYMQWIQFLVRLACACYLIDPAEINFDMPRGLDSTNPLIESSNEAKLRASKDRGLAPLLRFIQHGINDMYIHRIDPDFDFKFVGLDARTLEQQQAIAVQAVSTYKTLNEVRAMEDLPPVMNGEIIMNPTYVQLMMQQQSMALQQQQMQMQAEAEAAAAKQGGSDS